MGLTATGSDSGERPGYRIYVLVVLMVVYALNFLDRQIVGILAPLIKTDLDLSDLELGLMGGLAFALFYTALGVPAGRLADRTDRSRLVAWALALWSGCTALCGAATSFAHLFLARVGVGVGEAGGVAPSHAMISDLFPPRARGRALAAYSFGVPFGSAAGILFGGLIAAAFGWRVAFVAAGVLGLILAPILAATVRDPPRGRYDPPAPVPPTGEAFRLLFRKRSFWLLAAGSGFGSAAGYGLGFWLPSLFVRSYQLELPQISLAFGMISLFAGVAGMWGGGWLADRLGRRRRWAYAIVPAGAYLACAPFYAAAVTAPSAALAFGLLIVPTALGAVWMGPVLAAVQQTSRPAMRATASAVFLFVNNMIGLGIGTVAFGAVSDVLSGMGSESLRYAILVCLGFYPVGSALCFLAARFVARDWEAGEPD